MKTVQATKAKEAKEEAEVMLTARIDPGTMKALRALAEKQDMTVSQLTRKAIRHLLEQQEQEAA